MNMENVACMVPSPVEPLPGVSAYVSETLDDAAAMLSRVLDIIEGDAEGGRTHGEKGREMLPGQSGGGPAEI